MWRREISDSLVFALISFVEVVREGVLTSKTADMRIVAKDLGVLVPIPEHLAVWTSTLGFFTITSRKGIERVLTFVAFRRRKEVDWPLLDIEDLFFLYGLRMGEVTALAGMASRQTWA